MNFLNKYNPVFLQEEKRKARLKLAKDTKYYNAVYDVLETCGATTPMRQSFINAHTQGCSEWRFLSIFGEGTKYLSRYNKVSPNSKVNVENLDEINLKLSKIYKF